MMICQHKKEKKKPRKQYFKKKYWLEYKPESDFMLVDIFRKMNT